MNDILWNSKVLGAMKEHGCLTEEETEVMTYWARGKSIKQTAMDHHMGDTKVNNIRQRLRRKYDSIASYAGLEPRKK